MFYTSNRFVEQLNRYIEAFPEIDFNKHQSDDFTIDTVRKQVVRKQEKRYKFESIMPFEINSCTEFLNVSHVCIANIVELIRPEPRGNQYLNQRDVC